MVLLFWGIGESKAYHVLGADMRYTYISTDKYVITIDLYKDCSNSKASPITLNIKDLSGCGLSKAIGLPQFNCTDVTGVCKTSCTKCKQGKCNVNGFPNGANAKCTFNYGIEKVTFQDTFKFPSFWSSSCCKFRLSFSQGARTQGISTCCSAQDLYSYMDMDRCIKNSSPNPNALPTFLYNVGTKLSINIGATDFKDYDSISYELDTALRLATKACNYQSNYTYKFPFYYDGFPNMKYFDTSSYKGFMFDSISATLKFKPTQQQSAQVAILMREWRYDSSSKSMVNIGLSRRDLPLYFFIKINGNMTPIINGNSNRSVCAGEKICYDNMTVTDTNINDDVSITISNNIPNAQFSKKTVGKHDEWSMCWQTDTSNISTTPYSFTIDARDNGCPLPTFSTKTFYILVNNIYPKISFTATDVGCRKAELKALPIAGSNIYNNNEQYQWFYPFPSGDSTDLNNKNKSSVIQFNTSGYNIYKLKSEYLGCINEAIDSVFIDTVPTSQTLLWDSACKNNYSTMKSIINHPKTSFIYTWYGLSSTMNTGTFLLLHDTVIRCEARSLGCNLKDSIIIKAESQANYNINQNKYIYTFEPGNSYYTTYKWYFGDGDSSTQIKPSHIYRTEGKYKPKLIVTSAKGCAATYSDLVIVDSLPSVKLQWDSVCRGNITTIRAMILNGQKPFKIAWNGQTKNIDSISFLLTNDTLILIDITDSLGFYYSDSLYIRANPIAHFQSIKNKNLYNFIPLVQNYINYDWHFGDGDSSMQLTPYHLYKTAGKFIVKLEITTPQQCKNVYIDSVDVDSLPMASWSWDSACKGNITSFKASVKNGWPPIYYTWCRQTSYNDSISFLFTNDTTIYININDNSGYNFSDSMFIKAEPTAEFQISNILNSYTFTPIVKNYPTYFWHFGDGDSATQMIPNHTYTTNGPYTTKLIVNSTNGCIDSTAQTLSVTTGLKQYHTSEIKLYPNPTGFYSILEYNSNENTIIKVYDITGKEHSNIVQKNTANNSAILTPPSAGIYIVNVATEKGNYVVRWVVQ